MTYKLRILLLSTNALDLFSPRSGDEHRDIENRLRASPYSNCFEVIVRPPMRVSGLGEELMKYKPDILHFSGHGNFGPGIILEDDQGSARAVGAEDFAEMVRELKENIRLVFLNACYTQAHAEALSRDVDYAIGMSGEIKEEASLIFARHFYQALVTHKARLHPR